MEQHRGGILSFLLKCVKGKKEKEESKSFIENGSKLLEETISVSSNAGTYGIPIRYFSAIDIIGATNGFHEDCSLTVHKYPKMYKGTMKGRLVFVRTFSSHCTFEAIRNMAVGAHVSLHRNVLKLIGWCCLKEGYVAAVYEHHQGGRLLSDLIFNERHELLSWKCRLRIAYEIAYVIAYLHTALRRPMIHMDINPSVFIIDENGGVKLFDFSQSIFIPLGESHVKVDLVSGTIGFLDPEYSMTGFVTEKCDVYSFGMLLLQLLTGRPFNNANAPKDQRDMVESAGKNGQFNELVDPRILE